MDHSGEPLLIKVFDALDGGMACDARKANRKNWKG
jgi:hypothetical protein